MNLTSPADTLVCDTAQIALWQSDPAYNYNRELITPEMNVFEWISRQFGELFGAKYSAAILLKSIQAYPGMYCHPSFVADCLVRLSETSGIVYGLA